MTKTVGNKQGRTQTMKKIFLAIATLAVAFGFTACSNEDEVIENENSGKLIVTAFTEQGTTRTALDGNDKDGYEVVWSEGDKFYVYQRVQVKNPFSTMPVYKFQRVEGAFNLISEAGTTRGTFEREGDALPNLTIMALYSDSPEAFSPSYISDFYPTEQTYSEGNIKGFPMLAQINVNNGEITGPISFKNMNGILRLTVKGTATVKSIKVSAAELPTPITLDCGAGVELTSEGKLFHIAMPTDAETSKTYTDVVITLTGTDDKEICTKKFKGTNGLVIERSKITKASFSTYKVGDKLTIDDHEGIVVKINGKLVIVATMNVGATAVNGKGCLGDRLAFAETYTDWDGWRLPFVDEMETFCSSDNIPKICGSTEGGEDRFKEEGGSGSLMAWYIDGDDVLDLYLPLNDCEPTELGDCPYDKYWTGTGNNGKYFYFAPEIDWDGWDGFTYYPIAYDDRSEEVPYKEEADIEDIESKFLVRLFHDLP